MSSKRKSAPAPKSAPAGRRTAGLEAAPLAAAPEADAARAALALFAGLAALLALRVWASAAPGMTTWGFNHVRFIPALWGWPPLALTALALLPWLARPLVPLLDAIGDSVHRSPVASGVVAGVSGAAIVLAFPDRLRFVGDFLLRQGTVEEAGKPGVLFPQALPLDVLLHVKLPTWIMESGLLDANGAARALGSLEAGLLAVLAVMLVRVLEVRGAAALAVAALAWWSGALSMFTGYSKAFAEMGLLAAAAGVFALRSFRYGTPPFGLGVVLAIGLGLHRSALGLAPLWLLTWAWWAIVHAPTRGWKRASVGISLAIPLAALGFLLPRIIATFLKWDAIHVAPAEVKAQGGPLQAAFAGRRPLDLANLMLVLSPALPALLLALAALGRGLPRGREGLLMLALALPLTLVIPFIHPAQGLFRDWDDFASAAAALGIAGAWLAAEVFRAAPRFAWLALALALTAIGPSLHWLVVNSELERGLARIEALVTGPPEREGSEWGSTWDYLGIRNYRLERWQASARAFGNAAKTSPSPRILMQWGLAENRAGNYAASMGVYRRLVAKDRDDYIAWGGIAAAASALTDVESAREAAREMDRIRPGDRNARILMESIDDYVRKQAAGGGSPPVR